MDGDITYANYDYNNQGVCGSRSDRPAVWYEVRGRGAQVTVKVCTNNEVITDFGVFPECNSRDCTGYPPQTFQPANCNETESVDFSWFAENNLQYFVHVRSDVLNGVGSNFTIVYEDESLDGPETDAPTRAPTPTTSVNGGNGDGASPLPLALSAAAAIVGVMSMFAVF